jgi:uracil-DNA glycosylase
VRTGATEVDLARRRLKLLCESDRLLGVRDWPVARTGLSPSGLPADNDTAEDDPAMSKREAESGLTHSPEQPPPSQPAPPARRKSVDPDIESRLRAEMEQFPPEIEPPGADPENRPDPLFSAAHALKGSPVEAVKLKAETLAQQAQQVRQCQRCGLCQGCTQKVFGIGHPDTRIVFLGEAPGADEDRIGYPFVGRAGKLLTAMVEKGMGLRREHVYICNVVKCRPPENRTPTTDEMAACQDHLWAQLSLIEPEIVVALGLPATQMLLNTKDSLSRRRGQFYQIHLSGSDLGGGPMAKCLPTYHPAYLLRNPVDKRKTWEDLKKVMTEMGIPGPT